jgi:hypothetical protein
MAHSGQHALGPLARTKGSSAQQRSSRHMIVCVRELMQLPGLAPVNCNILRLIFHFEGLLEGLEFKSNPKPQSQTLAADYSRSGYDLPYWTGYKRRREQAFNNIHEPSGFVQSLKDDQLLGFMSLLLKRQRQRQRHRNLDAIKATHDCVTITPDDHGGKDNCYRV